MATVQSRTVSQQQLSTLFWINVTVGLSLTGVTCLAAPAIAWFYGDTRLIPITLVLAGALLVGGATVQHGALLKRKMRFGSLAAIEISSMSVGIVVAILLALLGWGYWSLVLMTVSSISATMVLTWLVSGWVPGRPSQIRDVRSMLSFGGHLTGFNTINYFARNADNIMIGWYWGSGPLGLYTKAYALLTLPIQQINAPISSVAIPALSRLQDEPDDYRRFYRRGISLLCLLGMPLVVYCFVDADLLVRVLLGPQWGEAVPMFRALAPAAFLGTSNVATGWVFVSLGETRRQFLFGFFGTGVIVSAMLAGLSYGPVGVAVGYSIGFAITWITAIPYCFKGTFLRMSDVMTGVWRPALASLAGGAVLLAIRVHLVLLPGLVEILVDASILGMAYLAFWLVIPGGGRRLAELLRTVTFLRAAHPSGTPA